MREGQVVRQVMDLLDILMAGGYCYYVRVVSAPALGHEGRPRKGQADLVGWITDRTGHFFGFAFEVKGSGGTKGDKQREDQAMATRAGGIAAFVWEIEDLFRAFAEAGVDIPIPYKDAVRQMAQRRLQRAQGRRPKSANKREVRR